MKRSSIGPVLSIFVLLFLIAPSAYAEEQIIAPRTTLAHGNFFTTFQANSPLKRPDGSKKRIYPFYQNLELSVADPATHITFNTYLRGREILNGEDRTFDVYNAFLEYKRPDNSFQVRLGRQVLTESTNFVLLDGGLVRVSPVKGIEVVAYGGYQDKDAQPDPEELERSFGIFGINLKSKELLGAMIALGYEGIAPDGFSTRQFLNFSFNRALPYTDKADMYSRLEFDLEEGNPALFTLGMGISPAKSLYLNFEYGTYKPDDDRGAFLQDAIFDIFSTSRLHEAKIGLKYYVASYLTISSSYSYARYDVSSGNPTNGSILRVGFSWDLWQEMGLKAFQGFYFIDGRADDRAVGLNLGLSQEILRGWDMQLNFAYAHVRTVTNQDGNAFSYIVGTNYLVLRDVALKAELEINTNPDFKRDVRTNLGVSYYF